MNIRWYLDRLRLMSLPEIIHRIHEATKRSTWRSYRNGWSDFDIGDGCLPIVSELGKRLETAANRDPALRKRIADESGLLLSGNISFLNHRWPEGTLAGLRVNDPDLFLRDPITGQRWPHFDAYCFDVPYRHAKNTGDVKYIWEINRLQFLQVAAAEARLSKDRVLAQKILDVILSWMDVNPPFLGINWCSGIELAIRIVTIVIVLSFLGEVEDYETRVRLRTFIHAHAFWIARYPSLFSSANNHLIAEVLGLFLSGTLLPDLPHAQQMADHGRTVLTREIEKQILNDGVGAEQSSSYTAFSVETFALAGLIGRLTDNSLPPQYEQRLASAVEFMSWLIDTNGCFPAIGDNDEGRVVALSLSPEPDYFTSVAASVGNFLGRKEFITFRKVPELRDAIFGTPTVASTPQRTGMRIFPTGGYTVVRETHAGQPVLLVFDHGPLGYLSIAAHGHADALAIWLHAGGVPVFVDAGTYLYHAGRTWRDYFRSTAAHNTMTIEGESGSISSGAFQWSHKGRAHLLSYKDEPNWYVEAQHDGYEARFGVVHCRRVTRTENGFDVADRLVGQGLPRAVSIRFLVSPDLTASRDGNSWRIELPNGIVVSVQGPAGFDMVKARADEAAPAGWTSMFFGDRRATDQLLFNGILGADPAITRISFARG
jgi:hypothetical protein